MFGPRCVVDFAWGGDFCAIFNPQKAFADQKVGEIVSRFLHSTARSQPRIREIAVAGELTDWYIQKIKNPHYQVQQIPKEKLIISDIILVEGDIVFCHYNHRNEIGIRIKHPDLYTSFLTVFELLWQSLSEAP